MQAIKCRQSRQVRRHRGPTPAGTHHERERAHHEHEAALVHLAVPPEVGLGRRCPRVGGPSSGGAAGVARRAAVACRAACWRVLPLPRKRVPSPLVVAHDAGQLSSKDVPWVGGRARRLPGLPLVLRRRAARLLGTFASTLRCARQVSDDLWLPSRLLLGCLLCTPLHLSVLLLLAIGLMLWLCRMLPLLRGRGRCNFWCRAAWRICFALLCCR